ncbi:MAG: hypothetical protein R3195_17685 [Gemmatimonadota bacterium]|nr:hypothetical protein [Gemmatimonadota bacterium]
MNTFLTQAAAEYVGLALAGALRSVGNGARSAGRYLESNPVALAVAVVVVIVLMRILGRRRV